MGRLNLGGCIVSKNILEGKGTIKKNGVFAKSPVMNSIMGGVFFRILIQKSFYHLQKIWLFVLGKQ